MIRKSGKKTCQGRYFGFLFKDWWMGPPFRKMAILEEDKLLRGNTEFRFQQAKFEEPLTHPHGDVRKTVRHVGLRFTELV